MEDNQKIKISEEKKEAEERKTFLPELLIIDSNSVIHRAYHALPYLSAKNGEPLNAVYGFLLVFLKAIKDFQPDYIAAAFDLPLPTFRHKKYKEYKAKRPPTPKELSSQIPKIKEVLKAFTVPIFEKKGFEADDVIGTISSLSPLKNIIISGDLDLLQLVDKQTEVYFLRKGVKDTILYGKNLVEEKFQGLSPKHLLDFKSLKGDASDNIPGVAGVGEKTAIELIKQFCNLENIYKEIKENSEKAKNIKPRLKEILLKNKEQAFLSKMLSEINKKVPLDFDLEKCDWKKHDKEKVFDLLKKFEFNSLINRFLSLDKKVAGREERDEKERKNLTLW